MIHSKNEPETQTVIVNSIAITPALTEALETLTESLQANKTTLIDGVFYLAQMEGEVEEIDKRFFSLMCDFRRVLDSLSQKGGKCNER
jgi:hypothetical protein